MGMAASQARFLGLTARKSNVEYQGQQVNQQRTALANESSNLLNQMMALDVPTPPIETEYYDTVYTLEGSSSSLYSSTDYTIGNFSKTFLNENEYNITLNNYIEKKYQNSNQSKLGRVTVTNNEGTEGKTYNFPLSDIKATNNTVNLQYNTDDTDAYTGENGSLKVNKNQIYLVDPAKAPDGYNTCCTDETKTYYFYQDAGNKNHFITQEDLDSMIAAAGQESTDLTIVDLFEYSNSVPNSTQVKGTLEKSSTGRLTSIRIYEDDSYPSSLSGKEFTLNMSRQKNEERWQDAYNEYEYQKNLYDKTIQDLNNRTEIIQKEDQNLELKLNQLDTEEKAINTEMEAVTKVIQNNVEKTFKIFA